VSGDIRYEQTDLKAAPVVRYAIGLLIFTAVSAGIAWGTLYGFREMGKKDDRPRPAMAVDDPARLPAEPRLQVHPTLDAAMLREQERVQLTSYGWVDQQKGTVHIPVERAIELLAARGVPARATSASPAPSAAAPVPGAQVVEPTKPGYRPGEPAAPRPVETPAAEKHH
jgi:hypothetical protein